MVPISPTRSPSLGKGLWPALLVFLAFAVLAAATKLPSSEEGSFSDPARNLLRVGSFGTTIIEAKGIWIEGIDRYTYWIMPLHPLLQAAWYQVWGASLGSLRGLSIAFGVLGILSWFLILQRTTGQWSTARLGALLLAGNYVYLNSATYGRMDMMAAALNFAGVAAYLFLRERNLAQAMLVAHALIAAAGMTHFLGLCGLLALLVTIAFTDGVRFGSWRQAAKLWSLAAVPYLVAALGWGLYISRDFPLFLRQFRGNATAGGRMDAFANPLAGLMREFTERFAVGYGFGAQSAGHASPAVILKATVLLVYVAALLSFAFSRRLRGLPGSRLLLTMTGAVFALLSLLEGQKLTIYLIHIVPFLSALTAVWLAHCWREKPLPRVATALIVMGLLGIDLGGVLLRARLRLYQTDYLPVIALLRERAQTSDLILGRANLIFGLGSGYRLKDDIRLGFYTRSQPQWIVVDEEYRQAFALYRRNEPQIGSFIDGRLQQEYDLLFKSISFEVYRRRPAAPF